MCAQSFDPTTGINAEINSLYKDYREAIRTPLPFHINLPTTTMRDANMERSRNFYQLPLLNKGLALLIDIQNFNGHQPFRDGSHHDLINLRFLFDTLGYKIIFRDKIDSQIGCWTKHNLLEILDEFCQECVNQMPPSIVLFFGSHGQFNHICTSDPDTGPASNCLHLESDILARFSDDHCPVLEGKPKIILISTCQGFPSRRIDNYSSTQPSLILNDMVIFTAQVPGDIAWRLEYGTVFIHLLYFVMIKKAREQTLLEMFKLVQGVMEKITRDDVPSDVTGGQAPFLREEGLKPLYFQMTPLD